MDSEGRRHFQCDLLFPAELLQLFFGECFRSALKFSQEFYGLRSTM